MLPARSGPFGREKTQRFEGRKEQGRRGAGGPEKAGARSRRRRPGGNVETSKAAVANQIYNTLIRAIEQERKNLETGELAERLEAMEEVLRGRRTG